LTLVYSVTLMYNLIRRLEKRGWKHKDIDKAVNIIHNAKQLKTSEARFFDKRIFWILLVVIIAANFAISVALIPALLVLSGMPLYLIIAIMGIVFGLLFEIAIRSIEHLKLEHHITLAVLTPVIAMLNIFIISKLSNSFIKSLSLKNFHSSFTIALIYAVSFVLPYIIYRFIFKVEYYIKE